MKKDGELLAEMNSKSAEVAFEQLVRRHGEMVFGVCRRYLQDAHAAEDAAQAVFFVLWKKSRELRRKTSVAVWLHRTARNVCRNTLRASQIRKLREQEAVEMMTAEADVSKTWANIKELIDEELAGLHESYRLPIILFHLENRSLDEVGELLGINPSTVGTRLQRGRQQLRDRLSRRGITIGSTILGTALTHGAAQAAAPASFATTTTSAASAFAAGTAATAVSTTSSAATLANTALRSLAWSKLKKVASTLAVATILLYVLVAPSFAAGQRTYQIEPAALSNGFAIDGGYITTSGVLGPLSRMDFIDYEIRITGPTPFIFKPEPGITTIIHLLGEVNASDSAITIPPALSQGIRHSLRFESFDDSDDSCTTCNQQLNFISGFSPTAQQPRSSIGLSLIDLADQDPAVSISTIIAGQQGLVIATVPEPSTAVVALCGVSLVLLTSRHIVHDG